MQMGYLYQLPIGCFCRVNTDPILGIGKLVDIDKQEGLVETVYRTKAFDKPEDMRDYIKIKQGHGGIQIFFGGNISETEMVVESKELADKIINICERVIINLYIGKESYILKKLTEYYDQMDIAHRDLAEQLEELRLTPLILRTSCEICPV